MTTSEQVAATGLQFPFVELNDAQLAFHQIPNYAELVKACPKEFMLSEKQHWGLTAFKLQTDGWTPARQAQAMELFITEDPAVAKAQVRYLFTWLGNYQSRHEVKIAVGGWLLSLMLKECPSW